MPFSADLIEDSISPDGIRLRSFQLRYPRMVHAELMTHRVFSRNASSSRAVPVERMIQDVIDDPAMPIYWGKNQSGMQAAEELTGDDLLGAQEEWLIARDSAVFSARELVKVGLHKQIVNRVLEPFGHIRVLVTATDFNNWFALRDHKDAQPEIREVARLMLEASDASTPEFLMPGAWHLPYVTKEDQKNVGVTAWLLEDAQGYRQNPGVEILKKISVARCARNSYKLHDGSVAPIEKEIELHDKLVVQVPLHASPAEHQATPDRNVGCPEGGDCWAQPKLHGNFRGWIQYRKTLPNEYIAG